MGYKVKQIAAKLGLRYQGDGNLLLHRVSSLEAADGESLAFLEKVEWSGPKTEPIKAGCLIVPENIRPFDANLIFSPNPKFDFARAAACLHPLPASRGTRHRTAAIADDAQIENNVEIGPYAVVESGAVIGRGSIIGAGVVIGEDCRLGQECILRPGVVLHAGVRIGDRVILHAGVVIGGDGFGYVTDGQTRIRFPQVGSVVLGSDVEIGSNTTIDRGSLGTTIIGEGTKVDNLVQIAHNVTIGKNVVIAAQTGISGSTVIEDDAIIGGQVGFGDHARVQKGAVIGSKAGVLPGKIVRSGETYWGVPVRPLREYKRLNAYFGKLPEMKAEIDSLRSEISRLRDTLDKKQS